MLTSKENLTIGHISNIISSIYGSMHYRKILETYGIEIDPKKQKPQAFAIVLRNLYKHDKSEFVNFLNTLLFYHHLSNEKYREINLLLNKLGYKLENKRVIEIPPEEDFFTFFEESLYHPKVRPAEEGAGDGAILTLTDKIVGMTDDFILIDFGCGQGRLIYGLNSIDRTTLSHLTYVGVDINYEYLEKTEENIINLGFNKKIKKYILLKPDDFFKLEEKADFIFLINVIHEIRLTNLPNIIYNIELMMKVGGILIIHEMREIIEGELKFISWDIEDFEEFFKNTNFHMNLRPYETRRGIPLINAYLIKKSDTLTNPVVYIDNMFSMIKEKNLRINNEIDKIYESGLRHRRFAYLLVLKYNLDLQKREYERKESNMAHPYDPFKNIVKCPKCESRNLKGSIAHDKEGDETYYIIKCMRCGWTEWTQ